jgi:hypothetical protein
MVIVKLIKKYPLWSLSLLLFAIALLLYVPTLHSQLFWDDNDFIVNNTYIKDWGQYKNLWTQNVIAGSNLNSNYWRPGLLTVFSIEWHLWGNSPVGFHAVNSVFHALNAVLIFLILYYLFKKKSIAFFSALIFVIHPLQTEAVSYANSFPTSFFYFTMVWFI